MNGSNRMPQLNIAYYLVFRADPRFRKVGLAILSASPPSTSGTVASSILGLRPGLPASWLKSCTLMEHFILWRPARLSCELELLIIFEKLGTLTVFRILFCTLPWDFRASFTTTFCRNLSRNRIVSTAETPLVYRSMNVSPLSDSVSVPEAAITAKLFRSSSSALA